MGCGSSKTDFMETLNFSIQDVENSLELSKISLKSVLKFLSNNNINRTMSGKQLKLFCKNMQLPLDSKEILIFHYFKANNNELLTEKIITLCTLLCKSSKRRKIKTLFKTYRKDDSVLRQSDITEMINNIFEIALEYLVKFTILYDKNIPEDDLMIYHKKLIKGKQLGVDYFLKLFKKEKLGVDYKQFKKYLYRSDKNMLINPSFIRKLSYDMQKSLNLNNKSQEDTRSKSVPQGNPAAGLIIKNP